MHGIELTPELPVGRVAELAATAETVGFDAAFVSCHYNNRDPFVALDRVAAETSSIELGPGVANPYDRHPVALASGIATLEEASGGRAVLGIGAGDRSTLSNLGIDRERPLERVLESIQVARALWDGERVDHDGTFAANDAGLNYPVESEIPVYVGAQGPHMISMAAKHADGALVNASHERDVAWAADRVDAGLAERVRDDPFDFGVTASVSVARDADDALEAARAPVAFIAGDAAPELLDRHGIDGDLAARIGRYIETGQFTRAFEAVTEPMLEAFCIAGTPAEVAERFDAILEHADSVVASAPLGPDREVAIQLLAEAVTATSA